MAHIYGHYVPTVQDVCNVIRETVRSYAPQVRTDGQNGDRGGMARQKSAKNGGEYESVGENEKQSRMDTLSLGDDELMEEGVESRHPHQIDEYQAAYNVTNAIQGMFMVSLPFAVRSGGYWALVAMCGVAYICNYTGTILIDCLYEPNERGTLVRVRKSYVEVAQAAMGASRGAYLVDAAQFVELLMTCILYVVLSGDLLIGAFSFHLSQRAWMLISGTALLPLIFIKSLKHVSKLSYWCAIVHVIINIVIVGNCMLYINDWAWGKVKMSVDMKDFPISLGVIVFSYTSHIFLPTLEGSMKDRTKFRWMLEWSHIWAAICKTIFGYVCFLTYQHDTQQVITNNLDPPAFKALVNICLLLKAILSYPLPYFAACELIEKKVFRDRGYTDKIKYADGTYTVLGMLIRIIIVNFTVMLALSIPHFAILMGLVGSMTGTMLSFIWPCYFHLILKGGTLPLHRVAFNAFVIFLGVIFGVVGFFDASIALYNAYQLDKLVEKAREESII